MLILGNVNISLEASEEVTFFEKKVTKKTF